MIAVSEKRRPAPTTTQLLLCVGTGRRLCPPRMCAEGGKGAGARAAEASIFDDGQALGAGDKASVRLTARRLVRPCRGEGRLARGSCARKDERNNTRAKNINT